MSLPSTSKIISETFNWDFKFFSNFIRKPLTDLKFLSSTSPGKGTGEATSGQVEITSNPKYRFATLILNRPIPKFTLAAVRLSEFVICADGGANRLLDAFQTKFKDGSRHSKGNNTDLNGCDDDGDFELLRGEIQKERFIVVGDLDSLRPDVGDIRKCID